MKSGGWTTYVALSLVSFYFLPVINAACPNLCSGHGSCSVNNKCVCDDSYSGIDCADLTCAYGYAWADKGYENEGHVSAECSNQGSCDRTTGKCVCFPGFEGGACQRASCHEDCGEHGKCMTISSIYDFFTPGASGTYSSWEGDHVTMCVCDPGHTGVACEMSK